MRITSKGQVTIPIGIRKRAGLMPNTEVDIIADGADVRIVKVKAGAARKPTRGEELVRRLQGTAKGKLTTDDVMRLMRGDD